MHFLLENSIRLTHQKKFVFSLIQDRPILDFCLNISECKTFLSVVEKLLVKAQKRYNHYRDVMDGGEATTRQQTLYMEAEENLEHLEGIKDSMKNFIRDYQKK